MKGAGRSLFYRENHSGLALRCAEAVQKRQNVSPPAWATHWETHSLQEFRRSILKNLHWDLLDLGLAKGDRVALYMESDTYFCMADMGCLIAGLIDVPIYLNQSPGTNEYILQSLRRPGAFCVEP